MSEVFKPLDDYAWVYGQTKNDLKKLAYEVKASAESKVPLELVVRKKILAVAKNISKEKYTYGTGPRQLVCNTFINKVFEKAGTDSLKTLSAQNLSAAELYEYFSPPKTNAITSANRESFASLNKLPQP